ncbi:MAG TPA: peptidoglycan DD-metalloendopeptidase family protein [Candidatus Cybelea sp.]|nr:peptidoglycan DD-metalloendopeptidase family protein [Candidatus Cybelea sp.]
MTQRQDFFERFSAVSDQQFRGNALPFALGTALFATAIGIVVLGHDSHHAKATRAHLLRAAEKTIAWVSNSEAPASAPAASQDTPPRAAPEIVFGNGVLNTPQTTFANVTVTRGDTLMKLLVDAGAGADESSDAIAALKTIYDPRRMQLGQEITLTFSQTRGTRTLAAVALDPSPERSVSVIRGENGFDAKEITHPLAPVVIRAGGTIDSSLFQSAQAAGIPVAVLNDAIRLFSYDVDFQREVQPGDTYEIYFERMVDDSGKAVRNGRILYASMTLSGHAVRYYRYRPSDDQDADYFSPEGQSVRKALLRTPIDGAKLTSGFGMRQHPILGYSAMHKGVDFGAPYGTPIMAAGDGSVEMAGWNGAYGKYVRIRHNGTYATAYAHMSAIASLHPGQHVHQGQVIGFVGATGRATGPHLHYEVLINHAQVNPLSVRLPTGRKLEGKELLRFKREIGDLDQKVAAAPLNSEITTGRN